MAILATASFLITLVLSPSAVDDVVSVAPCVLGDELQRRVDGSSRMLVRSFPPAAQQDPPCQSAVCTEPAHQPGHSPAHSSLLPLHSLQGELPAVGQCGGHRSTVLTGDVCQQGEVVFAAERECGRPCLFRLSEAGATQLQKLCTKFR